MSLIRSRERRCGRQRRRRRWHDSGVYGERTWGLRVLLPVCCRELCDYRRWISAQRPEEPRTALVTYKRPEWRKVSSASAASSMSRKRSYPRRTSVRQVSLICWIISFRIIIIRCVHRWKQAVLILNRNKIFFINILKYIFIIYKKFLRKIILDILETYFKRNIGFSISNANYLMSLYIIKYLLPLLFS